MGYDKNKSLVFRTSLSALLFIFGVYSGSPSHAYPASKAPSFSNSSRETPQAQPQQTAPAPRPSHASTSYSTPLSPGTHNLSLGVGQVFLSGNLSKSFDNSIGMAVHYTYGVSDLFSFESIFGYSSHSRGTDSLSLAHLAAGMRTNLIYFDQLIPFFSGGLGFYRPSQTISGTSVSGLLFGLHLGTGVDLILSDRFFFGSRITFHDMFDSTKLNSAGVNTPIGGSYISFLVHVGTNF